MEKPLVGILMGSDSDLPVMEKAAEVLKGMGVAYEMDISSAHRLPEKTAHYAKTARERGIEVLIAGAGMAAHLAGVLAAHTTLPVIGVPLKSGPLKEWMPSIQRFRCLRVFLLPRLESTERRMRPTWPAKSSPLSILRLPESWKVSEKR